MLTYPLRPGRLAVGVRYLWIELGQTSQGDRLNGNSAGMVADLGYETSSATNGQEVLAKVAAEAPDLILLDVMMPVMDGFTVCRRLKEQEETRLIPIVIMTALGAKADRITGIQAGADDFLTKPVDEAELVARIETALKLKHTVDRRMGELRTLKENVSQFVRLITMPDT